MLYTYDEYLARATPGAAPVAQSRTSRTIDSPVWDATNGPGTNVYEPGMTNREYVRENLGFGGNQYSAQNMANGMLNPVGGVISGIKGYKSFKKAKAAYARQKAKYEADVAYAKAGAGAAWLNTIDPTSRVSQEASKRHQAGKAMSIDEMNEMSRQEAQGKVRSKYESDIDAYFADPARAGWQRGIVQSRLQNDLANAQEDFDIELTGTGQQAASRGLKGGSVDVENRGEVARTRDTRAIQAGADADNTLADFGARDQQSRAQLRQLVNSGDIGSADALRSALDSINSSTAAAGAQYAGQQRNRQISQFGQQQQSQAWGGGLSAIANSINQNPGGYSWLTGSQQTQRGGW